MNEKPGETSNPLNQAPAGGTSAAPALDANPSEPVINAQAADPMARPMEQAATTTEKPAPKKKTGLIVGIIVALALVIGGVVAAVVLLGANRGGDPVARAIAKIMQGEAPENIAVNGSIEFETNTSSSLITGVRIDIDSKMITKSLINTSKAKLTLATLNNDKIELDITETYAADGDLFFKVDGLADAIEDYIEVNIDYYEKEYGVSVSKDELASSFEFVDDIVDLVDGEWLRVSTDEIEQLSKMSSDYTTSSECVTEFAIDSKNNANMLTELYSRNPFITSTTEGVTLASNGNGPVYKVTLDSAKFAGFFNDFQSTDAMKELLDCNGQTATNVSEEDAESVIKQLPPVYVEVDNDDNFTRLYFKADYGEEIDCYCDESEDCDCPDGNSVTFTTDLTFSFPDNVDVVEVTDYTDLTEVIEKIFRSYMTSNTTNYGVDDL